MSQLYRYLINYKRAIAAVEAAASSLAPRVHAAPRVNYNRPPSIPELPLKRRYRSTILSFCLRYGESL